MAEGKQPENEDQNAEASNADTANAGDDVVQNDKEPDLDALLEEYGKSTDSETKRTKDEDKENEEDTKLTPEEIRAIREDKIRQANERVQSDIRNAVKISRGDTDLPEEADPLIEGFLHQAVANNPKMKAAWEGRGKNPEGWEKILRKQSQQFISLIDKVAESRSSSNSALESAVHSSKTSNPSKNNIPGLGSLTMMSDADFAKLTRGG